MDSLVRVPAETISSPSSSTSELIALRAPHTKTPNHSPPPGTVPPGPQSPVCQRHNTYKSGRSGSRFGSPPGSWRGNSPSSSGGGSGEDGDESDSEEEGSVSSSHNGYGGFGYGYQSDIRRPVFVSPYKSTDQAMYLRSGTRDRSTVIRIVEHVPRDWMNAVHSIVSYKLTLCSVKEKRKLFSDLSTMDYVLSGARNTNLNQERADTSLLKILAYVPNEWIERIGDLLEKKLSSCDLGTIRRVFFHVAPLDEVFTHGVLKIVVSFLAHTKPTSAVQRPIIDGLSSVMYVNRIFNGIAFELRWRNIEEREIVFNKICRENVEILLEQKLGGATSPTYSPVSSSSSAPSSNPLSKSDTVIEPPEVPSRLLPPSSSSLPCGEEDDAGESGILGLDAEEYDHKEREIIPAEYSGGDLAAILNTSVAILTENAGGDDEDDDREDDDAELVVQGVEGRFARQTNQRLSLLASTMFDRMSGMRTHLESIKRIPLRFSQKIMYKVHRRKHDPVDGFNWVSFALFCNKIEFTRITFKCDHKQFDELVSLLRQTCPNLRYIQFILSGYKVNSLKEDAQIVSRLKDFPLRRIKFHNWMLARDLIRFLEHSYHCEHQHLYGLQMHIWLDRESPKQQDGDDNANEDGSTGRGNADDVNDELKHLSWEERQIHKYFPPRLKRLTFRTNRIDSDEFFYHLISKCTRLQKLLSCSVHTSRLPLRLSSKTLERVAKCRKLRECGFALHEINENMDEIWKILKSCKHLRKLRVVSFIQPPSELQFIQDFKRKLRQNPLPHIRKLYVVPINRETDAFVLQEWVFS